MSSNVAAAISVISAAISAISAITVLMTYILGRRTFSDGHEYQRRVHALHIMMKWDEQTLQARKVIMSRWEDSFNSRTVIAWAEIEDYRKQQIEKEKKSGRLDAKPRLMTDQMAVVMNYFEVIASALHSEIADEHLLNRHFRCTFDRWYTILSEYRRNVVRTGGGDDPWGGSLDWLHARWMIKDIPKAHVTGKWSFWPIPARRFKSKS
jgi:hypothetical protein